VPTDVAPGAAIDVAGIALPNSREGMSEGKDVWEKKAVGS
jgi:hypothetical protein